MDQTIGDPFCLASFTWHSVFKVYQLCSMCLYLIPFYGWKMCHHMDVWQLFIRSPADGQQAISTGWSLWVVLLWTHISVYLVGPLPASLLVSNLGMELLGSTKLLNAKNPFDILTVNVWRSQCLHILDSTFCHFTFFLIIVILISCEVSPYLVSMSFS